MRVSVLVFDTSEADHDRGTKDGDLFESIELTADIQTRLLAVAGPASELRAKHRMYIEIVRNGIPFLPHPPVWHTADIGAPLAHFNLLVVDVVDVVVSKLKRLKQNDLDDIQAMVERGLVPHHGLLDRFRAAVDYFAYDARADELPRYIDHLHSTGASTPAPS